jgi:NAD(P)-dependent dehydrogenase (short-subunit alcohol dehydrogenase family)
MARTNVVVGAASGMGAAVAELLAPRGPLLLADRDGEALADVAGRLGTDVATIVVDLADADSAVALAGATGELGSLVVTAGLSPQMAGGRRIYDVNLIGLARLLAAMEPAARPGSVAVCFASMAAHMLPASAEVDAVLDDPLSPSFFDDLGALGFDVEQPQLAYAVSKRGVVRLVRRLAGAWGARGARLVSLSPGVVDTGMGRLELEHEPSMTEMVAASALRRMARPEEVAAVAVFLASEGASFLTGADVLVDGGAIAAMG